MAARSLPALAGLPRRLTDEQLHQLALAPGLGVDTGQGPVAGGWMGAPLAALDGRQLGSIQLFDKGDGDFSELDEAVLIHLSQMAAAAIERTEFYRRRR